MIFAIKQDAKLPHYLAFDEPQQKMRDVQGNETLLFSFFS